MLKKTFLMSILFTSLSYAQLSPHDPWPMFHQNPRHTGWTNNNILGIQKYPKVKWAYLTGGNVFSSPAIGANGMVYAASVDDSVYAISNGTLKWSYASGNSIFSSPAIGPDGTGYVGSDDGKLYAITNGHLKWSFTTGNKIYSPPVIGSNNTVYVGSWDAKLYAITNGKLKWAYTTGGAIHSAPAIGADRTVVVASVDKKIYAITNGVLKWSILTGGSINNSSPAIGADGTVYVGSFDHNLYAITNGHIKWIFTTGCFVNSSPAIGPDGTVYVGSEDRSLYAITNGQLKWSYATGSFVDSSPAIGADGTIYVGSLDNKLYAITNGKLKWSCAFGNAIDSSPAIGADGTLYVGCRDSYLYAIGQGTLPSTPQWSSSKAVSGTEIDLFWEKMTNTTSYSLYKNTTMNTATAIKIGGTTTNITNYHSMGLQTNTSFFYWLKAFNVSGGSPFSSMISNHTLWPPPGKPTLCLPHNGFALNNPSLTFVWNKVVDIYLTNYALTIDGKSTNLQANTTNIILLVAPSIHFWSIKAIDTIQQTNTSLMLMFIVDTDAPNAPTLSSPANNTYTNSDIITFKWTKPADVGVSGISNFRFIISSNNFVSTQMSFWTINSNTTNYTSVSQLGEGTWTWKVQAKDHAGNPGIFSPPFRICIDKTIPTSVIPLSPLPGALLRNTPTLVWTHSSDLNLTNYIVILDGAPVATMMTNWVPGSLPEGSHSWRIKAMDKAGNSNTSPQTSFIIDATPPNTVRLIFPSSNGSAVSLGLTLSWHQGIDLGSGILNYLVQFASNMTFTKGVISSTTSATLFNVSFFMQTTNWWRVKAVDKAGNTNNWSSTWDFTVQHLMPPVWRIAVPLSTNRIDLSWMDLKNETSYTLFRNTVNTTNSAVKICGLIADTTNFSDTALAKNTKYYYWIRAYNNIEQSGFSSVISNTTFDVPLIMKPAIEENTFYFIPNPFDRSKATITTCVYNSSSPSETSIEIYTITGSLVKVLTDQNSDFHIEWNGKNNSGKTAADGIYLVLMRLKDRIVSKKPYKLGLEK